jgi:hypothetical protein
MAALDVERFLEHAAASAGSDAPGGNAA